MRLVCLSAVLILLAALSCGGDEREEILVFSAASLADVMDDLGSRFTEQQHIVVRFNFGGSGALAQQIVRGAPADAFIAAGSQPMDVLEREGLLQSATRVDFLTNELVLVASPAFAEEKRITSVQDLVSAGARLAIADPELAPAGAYARQALKSLGLWNELKADVVFSPDVRVALSYVESGNLDAGIVYRSDARLSRGTAIVAPIAGDSHSPIVYPGGVVERSENAASARKFLEFLVGDDARAIFHEHGFVPQD